MLPTAFPRKVGCPFQPPLLFLVFLHLCRAIEIQDQSALGLSAYINTVLGHPHPSDEEDYAQPDSPSVEPMEVDELETPDSEAQGSSGKVDRVLAAHLVDGHRHLLIAWEGHKVPTWIPDNGTVKHKYTCAELLERPDDDEEFQKPVSPMNYALLMGELRPLLCCEQCTQDPDHKDGLDYRVYIDASRLGNVSIYPALNVAPLTLHIQFTRFIVSH